LSMHQLEDDPSFAIRFSRCKPSAGIIAPAGCSSYHIRFPCATRKFWQTG